MIGISISQSIIQNKLMILGRKIMRPTATAAMTKRRTAPAATSFAAPIKGFFSGETLSQTFSKAVLKPSAIKTPPMQIMIALHSAGESRNRNPAITTSKAAARCTLAFASEPNSVLIPFHAKTKDLALFFQNPPIKPYSKKYLKAPNALKALNSLNALIKILTPSKMPSSNKLPHSFHQKPALSASRAFWQTAA